MRLTQTQSRIVDVLKLAAPNIVGGYVLRDIVMPGRDVKNVHVQIGRARAAGVVIDSVRGVHGGYRWAGV